MAQDYVGANNINLLEPKGQFGTRLQPSGSDASSPRYIFTHLNELSFHIYNQLDNPLLEYNEDDGVKIEPKWYIPILPMILVNGTEGIGTGYSTKVPPHDPEIIIKNLFNMMDDKPLENMIPWFRGFRGKIESKGLNNNNMEQYINKGIYKINADDSMIISELPIGRWIDDYKIYLESLLVDKSVENKNNKQCLLNITNNSTNKVVNFTLKFRGDDLYYMSKKDEIENTFKLTDSKYTNYSNMHLYNSKGIICKYDTVNDIIKEFYFIRLVYYTKRKEYMLKNMQKELNIYESKVRFIEEFINGTINILHKEDEEIEQLLVERNYPKFGKDDIDGSNTVNSTNIANSIANDNAENTENAENAENNNSKFSYDYLLNMKIKSLTKKKVEELKKMHENKLALYNDLLNKTEKDLWKSDLNNFLDIYRKKLAEYNKSMDDEIKNLNNVKNKVTKKGKK